MKQDIIQMIKQYETIIIHRHIRPDPDALGSQGGLADMIQTSFPQKNVYVTGQDEPSLRFMNEMDQVADEQYEGALVIVCDTANQDRIDDQRYQKGAALIKIDHHPNEDVYGDIVWVDTHASSVSEMIFELFAADSDNLHLSDKAAYLLYAGIAGDTGRFLFDNATERTYQIAGQLQTYQFSIRDFFSQLYVEPLHMARLKGYVMQNFVLSKHGVGHVKLTQDVLAAYQTYANEASQLVNAIANVEGMKAWVFFVEESDRIRIRLRSKGVTVNTIAKKYEGGGHPAAAGATIYDWRHVEDVLADLEDACAGQATQS